MKMEPNVRTTVMFVGPYVIASQILWHNILPVMAHVTQPHPDVATLYELNLV